MKGYFWLLNWRDPVVPHGGECISVWVRVVVHTIYIHNGELKRGEWWYSAELLLLPHFSFFGYRMPVHKMTTFFSFKSHYLSIPSDTCPEVQMIANLGRLTKINHHNTKIKYNTSSTKDLHNYFIKTLLMIT